MSTAAALTSLFSPLRVGPMHLTNRIFRTPLTRSTGPALPTARFAEVCAARAATAGLLVADGIDVVHMDATYVAAWQRVADAVHARGGHLVLQLSHVVGPRSLPHLIDAYATAARMFVERAGIDAIELYAANGCLVDEDERHCPTTLRQVAADHRTHVLKDVVAAVTDAVGGGNRVGIRFSPLSLVTQPHDCDATMLCQDVARTAQAANLAYVHLMHADVFEEPLVSLFRSQFQNVLVGDCGYTHDEANDAIHKHLVDAVAFDSAVMGDASLVGSVGVDHVQEESMSLPH
ncbi:Aste57867_16722 [Aphanomyces stellatus]|uniref:Aste57867_16722 protein n=1 Tax=Aphanomyces stellatus TaxID=120398 RepID=A0A485L729_9STRA|nr:hypothetical protein As57867_016665 [Aphanomyces stellatus]VFT93492.1 Aste57867_16722 [Aphanomyces stellatus]